MRMWIFLSLFFLLPDLVYSQGTTDNCEVMFDENIGREVYKFVDSPPVYSNGGDSGLTRFIADSLRIHPTCMDIIGIVYVAFIVEVDGTVSNPYVLRGVEPFLDKEALRVISTLSKFEPGKCQGEIVPVRYVVPIRFALQ
ncbi:MAG: hypothetical protein GC178_03215 [Flavobacteriales bacterium]|nr:hypothetical protein [Flavobacteriales bacterium]